MRDEVKRERRGCVGFPGARNPWEKVSQASQIQPENPITVVWVFLKLGNVRPSQFRITKTIFFRQVRERE